MEKFKIAFAAMLGALLTLFALQNLSEVEVTFLVWNFTTRRIVVISASFIVGLAIGLLIVTRWRSHAKH